MNSNMRARQNQLLQNSDGNFGTAYTYRCENGQPIERCLEKDFFETVKTRLGPADTIRVIEIKDKKVTAAILLVVVSRSEKKLDLDIRPYASKDIIRYSDEPIIEPKPEIFPPADTFIDGTGQVEKKRNGDYVVKANGKKVCTVETRALAMSIARGDVPLPK